MNRIEKMPPDNWLEQLEEWKMEAETTLKLLKKEMNRKNKGNLISENQITETSTKTKISCSISNGHLQFFTRKKENEKWIKKYYHLNEKKSIIEQLQQEYCKQLIERIESNLRLMNTFIVRYKRSRAWTYFQNLPTTKQMILTPIILPDKMFAEKWQTEEYAHKEFSPGTPEHYTSKKERVRSKSEVIIADTLAFSKIPYKYEMPLQLGETTIHPDFCCLNLRTRKEILWEHLGMMDDADYVSKFFQRLSKYENHGYFLGQELIITWETKDIPFNKEKAKEMIQKFLI